MTGRPPRVTVLACHHESGFSMRRYGEILESAYRSQGWDVEVRRPTTVLSRRITHLGLRKAIVYVEKLVLFPAIIRLRHPDADLVHIADHSDSPWLRSLGRTSRTIVTCHDLIAIRSARGEIEEHRPRFSGRIYQRLIARSLARADLILAVSASTLADVRRLIPGPRSEVLHNAIDLGICAVEPSRNVDGHRYALLVGHNDWRKRRHLAFAAWRELRQVVGADLALTVVGPSPLPDEISKSGLTQEDLQAVTTVGAVSNERLGRLYQEAEALLQTSKYEGFGWPIIEANHFGTVAICSDTPVFREVGPDNVFIADDPRDVDWHAVWAATQDPARRRAVLEASGKYSADRFSHSLDKFALSATQMVVR